MQQPPSLWTSAHGGKSLLFSNPTSFTSHPPRPKPAIITDLPKTEGSLWSVSTNEPRRPTKPQLWRPASESLRGLWGSLDEQLLTLAEIRAARRGDGLLWSNAGLTEAKFADLPLSSLRSKREASSAALPRVEEGMWGPKEKGEEVFVVEGMWSGTGAPVKIDAATTMLWTKDNASAPALFAQLADDTVRSKKASNMSTLPTFSEPLWTKRKIAVLSLWKAVPKPTGLWDAHGSVVSLTQFSEEQRRRSQKLLWSKKEARRTTEMKPEPRTTVAFTPSAEPVAVMSGAMWSKPLAQVVELRNWLIPAPARKASKSTETLAVERKGDEDEKVEVGGRLWTASPPPALPIIEVLAPMEPLWSRETAERTTTATPSRVPPMHREMNIDLPKATGSLWSAQRVGDVTVKRGPIAVREGLWGGHQESPAALQRPESQRTLFAAVPTMEEEEEEEEVVGTVSVNVGGGMWSAGSRSASLPAIPVQVAPLWAKETAQRTTDTAPERAVTAPRKTSLDLPMVTGSLWDKKNKENIVAKKAKVIVSGGLWPATLVVSEREAAASSVWDLESGSPPGLTRTSTLSSTEDEDEEEGERGEEEEEEVVVDGEEEDETGDGIKAQAQTRGGKKRALWRAVEVLAWTGTD